MYKNIIFVILQVSFIVWVGIFYFSDVNINKINKTRSKNISNFDTKISEIPLLENDTINTIEYLPESNNDMKKKKYNKFFELLRNDEK